MQKTNENLVKGIRRIQKTRDNSNGKWTWKRQVKMQSKTRSRAIDDQPGLFSHLLKHHRWKHPNWPFDSWIRKTDLILVWTHVYLESFLPVGVIEDLVGASDHLVAVEDGARSLLERTAAPDLQIRKVEMILRKKPADAIYCVFCRNNTQIGNLLCILS